SNVNSEWVIDGVNGIWRDLLGRYKADTMLERSPRATAIHYHEAGYSVIGRKLGIIIRPPQLDRGLRRHPGDVTDLEKTFELAKETGKDVSELPDDADSAPIAELCAVVFLAGTAALRRCNANASGNLGGCGSHVGGRHAEHPVDNTASRAGPEEKRYFSCC